MPRTFWSRDAFAEEAATSHALWLIRTRATDAEPQCAMTSEQVLAYLAHADSDVVIIQEFITSRFSGVTFVGATHSLSEALPGKCDGILRGGTRGTRWASSKSGTVQWTTGDAISPEHVAAISISQTEQLKLLGRDLTGHMFEWIVKNNGSYVWVDLKYLSLVYLSSFGPQRPRSYKVGEHSVEPGSNCTVLTDTRFSYAALLSTGQRGRLVCQSGSPLAHLCVSAYEAGFSVFVPETA